MQEKIRNFCIIAHIDHGKSTLADRILEATYTIEPRKMRAQFLDRMELERERGITIKLQAVRMNYQACDGNHYVLHLIDTPGHVDFSYEVSRSLKACEGAILLVDASQGVEAQTVANLHLAIDEGLEIIPVINKIDLPMARVEETEEEIVNLIGGSKKDILKVSAKTGEGVDLLLGEVVRRIPPPTGDPDAPLRALIFDSHYDPYKGIVTYIRIFDGSVGAGCQIKMMATGKRFEVSEVGIFVPELKTTEILRAGEVGYLTAQIKEIGDARVGDTITSAKKGADKPLPGYKRVKPLVFSGFYPREGKDFEDLKRALMRLSLNDSALYFEQESSEALGFGFRCGFLGMLHMEIVQERLQREFDLEIIATAPSVAYEVILTDGRTLTIDNPARMPDANHISAIKEPFIEGIIITPIQYESSLIELCKQRRGEIKSIDWLSTTRVSVKVELPLSEILYEFYDEVKSRSRGTASFDYEVIGYKQSELVRVDVLLNKVRAEAFSFVVHKSKAYERAKEVVETLKQSIPRHLFSIPIQAAIGTKVIARETIPALKKDVLAKCYGGDVTRKRKLLEKQRKGKQKMRAIGKVDVPQEAFLAVLKRDRKK